MTTPAKSYADVGKYPRSGIAGAPTNPSILHGGITLFPEWKEDSSIVYISCRAYRDFPITEFIEVVW
jgi:hypothetical protein